MVWILIKDMYYRIQKEVNLITHAGLNGLAKIRVNLSPCGS
jgi:hypothetical protein